MAELIAISISDRKGIPKRNVEEIRLIEQWGLEGDVHAGAWDRQVSLLADESIEKMRASGLKLRPGIFAENLTTRGISLVDLAVGTRLTLGPAELEVTRIGKECHQRCAIYRHVGDCVMPREGIFARVIRGGLIRVGDSLQVKLQAREE